MLINDSWDNILAKVAQRFVSVLINWVAAIQELKYRVRYSWRAKAILSSPIFDSIFNGEFKTTSELRVIKNPAHFWEESRPLRELAIVMISLLILKWYRYL
jgi:hypothetical protein